MYHALGLVLVGLLDTAGNAFYALAARTGWQVELTPEANQGALAGARVARSRIDMRTQRGEHPLVGEARSVGLIGALELVRDKGWVEFTVYPLFSPQSLLAEGTANYGIELLFPGDERLAYEREVLYPIAGIDPERARLYSEIQELAKRLGQARIEAARRYLDGKASAEQTVAYLSAYARLSPDRASRLVDDLAYIVGRPLLGPYDWGQCRIVGTRRIPNEGLFGQKSDMFRL